MVGVSIMDMGQRCEENCPKPLASFMGWLALIDHFGEETILYDLFILESKNYSK